MTGKANKPMRGCQLFGSPALVFEVNIAKLTQRYAGGAFDPARSQRRVDQALGTPA